jgi:hypothetical protein
VVKGVAVVQVVNASAQWPNKLPTPPPKRAGTLMEKEEEEEEKKDSAIAEVVRALGRPATLLGNGDNTEMTSARV